MGPLGHPIAGARDTASPAGARESGHPSHHVNLLQKKDEAHFTRPSTNETTQPTVVGGSFAISYRAPGWDRIKAEKKNEAARHKRVPIGAYRVLPHVVSFHSVLRRQASGPHETAHWLTGVRPYHRRIHIAPHDSCAILIHSSSITHSISS